MDGKSDVAIVPPATPDPASPPGTGGAAVRNRMEGDAPARDRSGEVDRVRKTIREAVKTEAAFNRELRIEVEKDLNMIVVKIVDKASGEVIRQIPMPESVENVRHIREQMARMAREQSGFIVSQEA